MSATPAVIRTDGFRSWFNDTKYILQDRIETMMGDPIFDLMGEELDPSRSDRISITGRDNTHTARTKSEGGQVSPQTPVEEDQKSQEYITFEYSMVITYESMAHDQYRFATDDPSEMVDNTFRGISRLFHAQLFNAHSSTTVTLPGTGGAYDIAVPNGQAVYSSSQSGPGYSGKSNLYSDAALTVPNITLAGQHGVKNFVTSTGERMDFRPDLLIVPHQIEMVEAAVQNTRSKLVPGTANNSVNYYSGGVMDVAELMYSPEDSTTNAYSTAKQYYWLLCEKARLKKYMQYKFIERPRVLTKFMDPDTGDSKITVLARVATLPKRWQYGVFVPATSAPTHPGL